MALSRERQATLELYAELMEEVKVRIRAIEHCIKGQSGLPSPLVREFCYLQLRMICELIAFACLVAHGDIKETKGSRFTGEYKAGVIVNALEKLLPDFYPVPTFKRMGEGYAVLDNSTLPYLTKPELLALNGKCGDILHRGTLKKLLSEKMPIEKNYNDIQAYTQKIASLLSIHRILLADRLKVIICQLSVVEEQGRCVVYFGEAGLPPQEVLDRANLPLAPGQGTPPQRSEPG